MCNVRYPGRIRTIFTMDDGEPHLIVAYLWNLTPLTCAIDRDEDFIYPNILHTSASQWNYVPIELKDLLEKTVFFFQIQTVLLILFDFQLLNIVLKL